MPEPAPDWADTLHRLWRSVLAVRSRDELAGLLLPSLLTLPGVRAVWGLRLAPGAALPDCRWAGPAAAWEHQEAARRGAAPPELGVTEMIVGRLDMPGEVAGLCLVGVGADADVPAVTGCLDQIVEVSREALRLLAARSAEQEQQTRDALLAEASLQMDAVLHSEQTVHRVPRMTVPAIADGCLVYLLDRGKPVLRSAVHVDVHRGSALLGDPATADRLTALAGAAVGGATVVDARDAAAIGTRFVDLQLLRARGRVIGVLIFLFDRGADRVPSAAFLRDIAFRAALAIDNSTLYEQRRRDVAAMQRHLLPGRLPTVDGLCMAASYTVGDEILEVGGDFYDVVVRADGSVAATIGDVCGRGVDAAALTGMARHTLAALLQEGAAPKRAMNRLNALLRLDGSWRFITAGAALLRPDGDGFAVEWTSAGHPAPVVLRRGRGAHAARGGGVPLGVLAKPRLGRSRLHLAPGDTLVIFTDGLTERRDADGRMFEQAGFWETMDRLREAPPDKLVNELSVASAGFGGSGADDIAVLAIRVQEADDDARPA